ncbi:TldD/PmbA family protein [Pseudomonas sp. 10B1]|uniref:TldD/PmbA family protein n=1 Tax=unclassified Pseudomonas TaxID=196821 RepID=UPI002AB54082|nr:MULTISPECIES: TldD/PmbA family protein [unclassified Pseudomonas]MDY7563039.1 TldD/PmbA family protein [Pseudomonas sp. AB6]MEA9996840.1 TldD/PmbA family protein [Pseudomonas sp. AA4]MEB0085217.1 TldD/PmbA family protein [Pseudomonas sp. RTI1]MEB0125320.1 TldD/PmbA family protein [Pseudomonas sp. CCC1.2]MEB0153287.1 TldD/PmbA family protein [Pseudomonas sp. CCC4.3]
MEHLTQQQQFTALVDWLRGAIAAPEAFTLGYNAEASEFIRFNHAKVRQAGHVQQADLNLKLINDGRHADLRLTLSGDAEVDQSRLAAALQQLRETLVLLPQDPYLLPNTDDWQISNTQHQPLPDSARVLAQISELAEGLDLVGFYAAGPLYRGFASSWGALGWHQANSFNFDWSLFHANGQAVKASYAGDHWDDQTFAQRFQQARKQLEFLGRPLHALAPGEYRAYLAPAALEEVIGMLCWGGFSADAIASKTSPLQRLYNGDAHLSPLVSLNEQVTGSLSPAFSGEGYPRSDLSLISEGRAHEQLVGSRSAAEYGLTANGAGGGESPSALSMAGGTLALKDILKQLGTGLYISNLWYLNFSDQSAARLTGMTRFATFWVENGEIQAPVNTMRFDDSVYSLLGSALEQLTRETELILSASTYSQRQTASSLLPGALISRLTLTL